MDSKMMIRADERTWDVLSNKTFDQLLINPDIVGRLAAHKFTKPTPVQAGAIPLGILGNDLLVQAKSGTGKTLVFATLIAHTIAETAGDVGVVAVVVVPVREIALQIKDVVDQIAPEGTRSCAFIGGEDVKDNKSMLAHGCTVAIGTPGRLAQLLRDGALNFKNSKIFVLDESDKLMDASFTEDVKHIYNSLNPETTQVLSFSATYPNNLDEYLSGFMKTPVTFRLDSDNVQLLGIHQYVLDAMGNRAPALVSDILDKMSFSQVIIFANDTDTCYDISKAIERSGKHKALVMSGQLDQDERKKVITALKNFAVRIMISTDVTSRGIDALNVNFVINVGVPKDPETYLHRIGRAGRYGGNGASITLLTNPQELSKFIRMAQSAKLNVKALEFERIPYDLTYNEEFFGKSTLFVDHCSEKVEKIKAQVSGPSTSQDRSSVASSDVPSRPQEKETVEKPATDSKAADPIPSTSTLNTPVEETPAAASQDAPSTKENEPANEGIALPTPAPPVASSSQINAASGDATRSSSGTSQTSTRSHGGLLAEFTLKKNVTDWNYMEPIKRVEKIEVPLALVDVDKVRQYVPDFQYDEEKAIENAIKDRANQPIITGVKWVPPQPRRGRGRGAPGDGVRGRGRGGFEGGYSRGGYNNDSSSRGGYNNEGSSRGGYNNDSSSRGGYNNDTPARGGFESSSRGAYNSEGGYGRGGSRGGNDGAGFGRGGFGNSRGTFNNDNSYGRGGGRGAFGQSSVPSNDESSRGGAYFSGRGRGGFEGGYSRGGFNNDAPARGAYNNDTPARGGFNNDGPSSRGGYNNDAPARGAYNNEGGYGRGGSRGGNDGAGFGRGGFGNSRGTFNNDNGYGRGGGRGAFGQSSVPSNDESSRGGAYLGGGRGACFTQSNVPTNEESNNRGAYMGGGRGSAFGRGRGSAFTQQPEPEVSEQNTYELKPRSRFVR